MKTLDLPRASGIYEIRNLVNGKLYIGSACDLQKRLLEHRRTLKNSTHRNSKLQNAWNKYGEQFFEVKILELVPEKENLLEREQFWLDVTQAVKNGYNLAVTAGSNFATEWSEETKNKTSRTKAKSYSGFISPEGKEVVIENMRSFCRENGLGASGMYALSSGSSTSYKGWTHVNSKKPKREWISTYKGFISPNGKKVPPIVNLEKFCSENGLIASNMNKVYRGRKRSHKGWTHISTVSKPFNERKGKVYKGFVNPKGEQVVIGNLTKFCRDNALDHASMWKVMQGKARQHKGWTYQPQNE